MVYLCVVSIMSHVLSLICLSLCSGYVVYVLCLFYIYIYIYIYIWSADHGPAPHGRPADLRPPPHGMVCPKLVCWTAPPCGFGFGFWSFCGSETIIIVRYFDNLAGRLDPAGSGRLVTLGKPLYLDIDFSMGGRDLWPVTPAGARHRYIRYIPYIYIYMCVLHIDTFILVYTSIWLVHILIYMISGQRITAPPNDMTFQRPADHAPPPMIWLSSDQRIPPPIEYDFPADSGSWPPQWYDSTTSTRRRSESASQISTTRPNCRNTLQL